MATPVHPTRPCAALPPAPEGHNGLAALRHAIGRLETAAVPAESAAVSLGLASLDAALGGGLAPGFLHEVAAENETGLPAASGFALGVAARLASAPRARRSLVWIAEGLSLAESGAPYGPGLDAFGLAPERLVIVAGAQSREVMWAMEEGLRCPGVGAVIGEVRGKGAVDPVAARRLSLAAGRGGGLALLLRAAPDPAPSPAATRWVVRPAPGGASAQGLGAPRLLLRLLRNRRGSPGAWMVEWNCVERRFELAATHLEPVAEPARDRPHRARGA